MLTNGAIVFCSALLCSSLHFCLFVFHRSIRKLRLGFENYCKQVCQKPQWLVADFHFRCHSYPEGPLTVFLSRKKGKNPLGPKVNWENKSSASEVIGLNSNSSKERDSSKNRWFVKNSFVQKLQVCLRIVELSKIVDLPKIRWFFYKY